MLHVNLLPQLVCCIVLICSLLGIVCFFLFPCVDIVYLFDTTSVNLFGMIPASLFAITTVNLFDVTIVNLFGMTNVNLFGMTNVNLFDVTIVNLFGMTIVNLFGMTNVNLFDATIVNLLIRPSLSLLCELLTVSPFSHHWLSCTLNDMFDLHNDIVTLLI